MRQRFVQIEGELVPANEAAMASVHHIMPDIEPFTANTGAYIEGRRQWREHLKEKNCEELGHADVKERGEKWQKKREAFREKLKNADRIAPSVEASERDFTAERRSRLAAEVLNRLDGKATPSRKEVIRLTLELAKRGRYGRR